ncbi:NAD(P)-dependent oxidoreductase [Merdimmobilis hominis]|uniref:NAD(P)-dependent oxidoreductase n=1 Tax=Merdimmobilis hominis TaxID=2897707 RepID=UPI0008F947E0|nr:NAD(P)-dependent oxidoreductase [Merdimmobilis hominis]
MFQKTVVVDFTGMNDWAKDQLRALSREVVFYDDFPKDTAEVIRRIQDADCVMVSYNTLIPREAIEAAPNLRYIGMCCTLYNEKSANVDIAAAREWGIVVTGIRDYGDVGVYEFAVASLVDLLHGFHGKQWRERPYELGGIKVAMLGMGTTGQLVAKALQFFGCSVRYYSRHPKPEAEAEGFSLCPLEEILPWAEVVVTQLPKKTALLGRREFQLLGDGKILLNMSIGPTFDLDAIKEWLRRPGNFYICEDVGILGTEGEWDGFDNVIYSPVCAGSSVQCTQRLSEKSIQNLLDFIKGK